MEEKKLDVIPIATRLFAEKGYSATSVEEIAKESGMAKGSFYKLFHSKEDLLVETFMIIAKKIEAGLMTIHSKNYATHYEKLVDFISLALENILSNQAELFMDMASSYPLFKNKEIEKKAKQINLTFQRWIREFLLDLYGKEIEAYLSDLLALLPSLIFQYVHLFRYRKIEMDTAKSTVFIATVFDIIVEGLLTRKPEAHLEMDCSLFKACTDDHSPRSKGQKIQFLLKRMVYIVKGLKVEVEAKEEYTKMIVMLEKEVTQRRPRLFLVKALLHYLQVVAELEEDCVDIGNLLEIQ